MPAREPGQCWAHVIWVNHQGMTERRPDSGEKTKHSRRSKASKLPISFACFEPCWTESLSRSTYFFHQPTHAISRTIPPGNFLILFFTFNYLWIKQCRSTTCPKNAHRANWLNCWYFTLLFYAPPRVRRSSVCERAVCENIFIMSLQPFISIAATQKWESGPTRNYKAAVWMEYPVAHICHYEALKGQGGVVVCGRWVLISRKRRNSSTHLV